MRPPRHRLVALCLLGFQISACASWQPSTVGPSQLIQEERPQAVRVTHIDGRSQVIRNPTIARDSVAVFSGECRRVQGTRGGYQCPTTGLVALSEVRAIEAQAPSRATALIFMGVAVTVVAGYAIQSAWSASFSGR